MLSGTRVSDPNLSVLSGTLNKEIARHTTDFKISSYATVSRSWKEAVEVLTYRTLTIRSNEIRQFRAIVTNNRRRYVKELSYKALLPDYSEEACGRHDRTKEKDLMMMRSPRPSTISFSY